MSGRRIQLHKMTTSNALRIHDERRGSHVVGYRCRACGHVSDSAATTEPPTPLATRCAHCGLAIAESRDTVGVAEIARHFEPLVWWDELAA